MPDKKDETAPVVAEKVNKALSDTGEVVVYHNAFVPTLELDMPKSDWERLKGEGLLGNAVFIRMKGEKA